VSFNFAITGVAGFVAPRHLRAIRDTGNRLVAAIDPHDAVGVLDQYTLDARYFPEIERFDRHLEKLRRRSEAERVHYLSVCSPNYLHDAHVRMALRIGAHAICEKPLVINPWNLDALALLERESEGRVYTVLQLRLHPSLLALRERVRNAPRGRVHDVRLSYVTGRGEWYHVSWKGSVDRSGGLATNIGVHLFDALIWLFGDVQDCRVGVREPRRVAGFLDLEHARVEWLLSVDVADLPFERRPGGPLTHRSMTVDGEEIEFTAGFTDLHTRVYEETLAGRGFGIDDARPAIELAHRIRNAPLAAGGDAVHPLFRRARR
jgi:UDP-N-acetyl-2-amino-2-deoxyglucuronate dehydrogenase